MSRPERNCREAVLALLKKLSGLEVLKELFWSKLNYEHINVTLPRYGWMQSETDALAEDPVLFAASDKTGNGFQVIYARLASDELRHTQERLVVNRLLKEHPHSLFIFSDRTWDRWHFVNVKDDGTSAKRRIFRRITVGPEERLGERLRTACQCISDLDLSKVEPDQLGLIQRRHAEAFDVEAVTRKFFDDYKATFTLLQNALFEQTSDQTWAHDYALQFLNRCMFLYFVQRKRWLGDDTEFLKSFWKSYQSSGQPRDSFFDQWLKVLFFEAFNNKFHGGHTHFPKEIQDALALAPYLNGGLFAENDLDRQHGFNITDTTFSRVFNFLELYNFTIAEDSPLDQEVAVDPEMIGKVYESLVNVSEVDERGEAGIFYTPRTEIDLMCRLTLVDHLANHLGQERKELLYEAVFALEPDEKADADRALTAADLWADLNARLRQVTVVDPACGSGSFLVGMLNVLNDLQERANKHLGVAETPYERKRRIIGQSLYGVDVMEWAVHVAELRLWLALTVDAEFTREDLHIRNEPLLPYFTFKVRRGDSLVQEIGGVNLAHIRGSRSIAPSTKARLKVLKAEKLKFYNNDPTRRYHSNLELRNEELALFRTILDDCDHDVQEHIKTIRQRIEAGPQERQMRLDGTVEAEGPRQLQLQAQEWQRQLQEANADLQRIEQGRAALRTAHDVPFVWDIAFVEIFEGDERGFDIVIGNPPYVRQESIADPNSPRNEVTADSKRLYKAKLARSVYQAFYQAFPRFFGYNRVTDLAAHKLDAKSDLYIYFYFHGLYLLNSKGSFCFITSNSWLDVGYGADLQEFLLRHCHVEMVIDNQAKRSFISADINTVIVLLSAPNDSNDWGLDQVARFIMFKVPFEYVLSPVIFEEIEATNQRKTTPEYRLFPIEQKALFEDGIDIPDEEVAGDGVSPLPRTSGPLIKAQRYIGNKWGGKYLRAPDIYWTVLERGKGKLARLGEVGQVRFGMKTGANDFFYMDRAQIQQWAIPDVFLKPVIISPRECRSVEVVADELQHKVFVCHESLDALKGTAALEYIRWGESQGFHLRPSCRNRLPWYDLPERQWAKVLWPMIHNDRQTVLWNPDNVFVDHNLFEILNFQDDILWGSFAWSGQILFRELHGRANLGQGALKTEGVDIRGFRVLRLQSEDVIEAIRRIRQRLSLRSIGTVAEEAMTEERQALDDIFFDMLALSQRERDDLYAAVISLVESRLTKAESLLSQERRGEKRVPQMVR